jgi:ribokinase
VHLRTSPLPQELPAEAWDGIEAIHICPMRLESILAWTDFLQDKPHIFVSVDILPYPLHGNLDDPHLRQLLRRVNAFMPSEAEAESLLPAHEAQSFCRQIAARGPRFVVIKQGDHGAAVFDRERDLFLHVAPYPATVADLTGAGDSFCGGFAVGLAETGDIRQAAYYGTVSASFIIEGFGGLHALSINRAQAAARLAELDALNLA